MCIGCATGCVSAGRSKTEPTGVNVAGTSFVTGPDQAYVTKFTFVIPTFCLQLYITYCYRTNLAFFFC